MRWFEVGYEISHGTALDPPLEKVYRPPPYPTMPDDRDTRAGPESGRRRGEAPHSEESLRRNEGSALGEVD